MRTRHIVYSSVLSVAVAFSATTQADSTLRVGNQVLTAGDSAVRVTELLGKPSRKYHIPRSRRASARSSSRSHRVIVLSGDEGGEKWQYRRDDHATTVTIVDGKVTDIDDHRI